MQTPSLNAQDLIDIARRETGLADFGEPSIVEPLQRLTTALEVEAQLNAVGRQAWHHRLLGILQARLRAEYWFAKHPEILDEKINAPLVILGLTRTGTTLLQRLISSDTRFYFGASWEVFHPVPTEDDLDGRKRIAIRLREIEELLAASPELAAIHPWDALGSEEDILLLDQTLLSTTSETMACIPSYHHWIREQDLRPAYRYLKKMLQLLQWQKKRRGVPDAQRWLLKAPIHLGYVDIIDDLFPDADFVQTHRDPVETIPSYASMVYNLWRGVSDNPDPFEAGREVVQTLHRDLYRCMTARDALSPQRFFDVNFRETVTDPIGLVERIYHRFGMPMTATARAAIEEYMRKNPREKRPPHHYTVEQFGLSAADLEARFALYRERHIQAG